MKSFFYLTAILLLLNYSTFAQNVEFEAINFPNQTNFENALSDYTKGSILFDNGTAYCDYNMSAEKYCLQADDFYKEAIPYLEKALSFNNKSAKCNFMLGVSYLMNYNSVKATNYLETAYYLNNEVDPLIEYYLGWAHQHYGNWYKAIDYYKTYIDKQNQKTLQKVVFKNTITTESVHQKIAECFYAESIKKDSVKCIVTNMGNSINTVFNDYGAVISKTGNTMLFTSKQPDFRMNGKNIDTIDFISDDDNRIENIYISYKKNDSVWSKSKVLGDILSTVGEHKAILDMSDDSRTLLIYKSQKGGDIFKGIVENGDWVGMEKMEGDINSPQYEPSAFMTNDGLAVYFSSDRAGGVGEKDIYSKIDDYTQLGKVENLGNNINTNKDEDGVFLSPDGKTLYFSSKGHLGFGGYDIFKSTKTDSGWSKPKNMGYPINTSADDIFFSINEDGTVGYVTSNRNGTLGMMDVFKIDFIKENQTVSDSLIQSLVIKSFDKYAEIIKLVGQVSDNETKKPLEAEITLTLLETKDIYGKLFSDNKGTFLLGLEKDKKYNLEITANGYEVYNDEIQLSLESDAISYNTYLTKKKGTEIIANFIKPSDNPSQILLKIYPMDINTGAPLDAKINVLRTDKKENKTDFQQKRNNITEIKLDKAATYRIFAETEGYIMQSERIRIKNETSSLPVTLLMIPKKMLEDQKITSSEIDTNHRKMVIYKGTIKEFGSEKPLSNALVEFYGLDDSIPVKTVKSDSRGKFEVLLPGEKYYKTMVNSDGYLYQKGFLNASDATDVVYVNAAILPKTDAILKNNVEEQLITQNQIAYTVLHGKITDNETNKTISGIINIVDTETNEQIATKNTDIDGEFFIAVPRGGKIGVYASATGFNSKKETIIIPDTTQLLTFTMTLAKPAISNLRITLSNLLFDSSKYEISSDKLTELNEFVQLLNTKQNLQVRISGHADASGPEKLNETISEKRAKSVENYLMNKGVDSKRIHILSFGETKPIASNETEDGKRKNRRVEIEIFSN
ncbi:MAG: OmpA family protein [Bacteroidales bacterium]|nr:OmpA family protein [Bacteroidales bacterium]